MRDIDLLVAGNTCRVSQKKVEEDIVTTADNLILRNQTWTHVIHQMSLASDTSRFFESFLNFRDVSFIEPHSHIDTTTHIPQQPSKPKHHITHLILQFFNASCFIHFNHFIPDFLHTRAQLAAFILQASASTR